MNQRLRRSPPDVVYTPIDVTWREGQEPDNVDKEFLRLWFRENCNPYEDEVLPPAPYDLVIELSRRYIYFYEKSIGHSFEFPEADQPIETRLESNLEGIT